MGTPAYPFNWVGALKKSSDTLCKIKVVKIICIVHMLAHEPCSRAMQIKWRRSRVLTLGCAGSSSRVREVCLTCGSWRLTGLKLARMAHVSQVGSRRYAGSCWFILVHTKPRWCMLSHVTNRTTTLARLSSCRLRRVTRLRVGIVTLYLTRINAHRRAPESGAWHGGPRSSASL